MIQKLIEIKNQIKRKAIFRFYFGRMGDTKYVMLQYLSSLLGSEWVELAPVVQHRPFLDMFQLGHLFIDSHHHGASNGAVDALVTRVPLVLWEGDRWNNRIGCAMLKRAGLGWLVVQNGDDYVNLIVRLVNDPALWLSAVQAMHGADLDKALFNANHEDAHHLSNALHYIIKHHNENVTHNACPLIRFKGTEAGLNFEEAKRATATAPAAAAGAGQKQVDINQFLVQPKQPSRDGL